MPFVKAKDGANIYYDVINITPPWKKDAEVIFFHHGVSTNSGIWSDWLPVLAQEYKLVRADMRGFGRSDVPGKDFDWSFDQLVDDAFAVIDAVGAEKVHFVGESIGGTAALAAAMNRPERLWSLTVTNGAHCGHNLQNVRGVWRERIGTAGQASWAQQMMEWRFHPDALSPEKWDWFLDQQATCSADATLALADLLLATDLSASLAEMRVPTLLLSPDASPFISAAIMSEFYGKLPDAELQIFAHARHGLPLSHSQQSAAALADFLRRRFPRTEPMGKQAA